MAPITTPGKKVHAPTADLRDPKQILKARHLNFYERLSEADRMTEAAGKMEKDIKDVTQQELLSAIADEGDKNRLSRGPPPPGDPSTWKFEGRLQQLLDAYNANFVPEEPYLADAVEHFCVCNGEDDGRPMIECSNGSVCLMNWFHFECIGMAMDEIPDDQEPWFCQRCIDNKVGKLRKNAPKSISQSIAKKQNADRIKHYEVVEEAAARKKTKKFSKNQKTRAKKKEKKDQKTLTISTTSSTPTPSGLLDMSTPSPGSPGPWTADMDKTFADDPEVIETYSLRSATSAKAALRLRAASSATNVAVRATTTTAATDADGDLEMSDAASDPIAKRNKGSWTQDEKDHLIACVKASKAAGLCGELLWNDVYPNMVARGVDRPLGGMKNTWLRGLREQTGVDERRREDSTKMTTAVQKPKKQKPGDKAAGNAKMGETGEVAMPTSSKKKKAKQTPAVRKQKETEKVAAEACEKKKAEEEKAFAAAIAVMPIESIALRARAMSV